MQKIVLLKGYSTTTKISFLLGDGLRSDTQQKIILVLEYIVLEMKKKIVRALLQQQQQQLTIIDGEELK